jgi:CRP-like cAMP-binding protein
MQPSRASSAQPANRLLACLPPADYQRLLPKLQAVPLPLKQVLYKAYARIDYLYFPTAGVVSAMTIMEDGSAIEVATIGNEGVAGLTAFSGGEISPNEVMVQVAGDALRVRAKTIQEQARQEGPLRRALALYHTAFQTQVSYAVACNGLHTVQKRCCRWLLMTADRVGGDMLPLTHDLLAIMLGVRRSTVTEVLQPLQVQGLIQNERGKVIVLDRPGLEAISCECYRRVKEEFARLFG